MFSICQQWHKLPSEYLHIDNEWLAWQFDRAVTALGLYVENQIELSRGPDGKVRTTVENILKTGDWRKQGTIEQLLSLGGGDFI